MKTRQEELDEVNKKWDFRDKVHNMIGTIDGEINTNYRDSRQSIWVNTDSFKTIGHLLNTLLPINKTTKINYKEVDTSYKVSISNPSHSRYKASFSISWVIECGIEFWFTTTIEKVPELIVNKKQCKYPLFVSTTNTPPDTAMVHYPGMTRSEVEKVRVPGYTFSNMFARIDFQGGACLIKPEQINDLIRTLKTFTE